MPRPLASTPGKCYSSDPIVRHSVCLRPNCRSTGAPSEANPFLIGLLGAAVADAQTPVPQIAFDSVPDAIKMPKDLYLGEASGVAVNSKGHVFVFSRGSTTGPAYAAAAAQLLEFDENGRFVCEIGKSLYAWPFAHTVGVDRDDNIWCTDKGSDDVVKFSPEGRVLMTERSHGPLVTAQPSVANAPSLARR